MNETRLRALLRDADQAVEKTSPAAAEIAAAVRGRCRRRADRRRDALGVLAAAALAVTLSIPNRAPIAPVTANVSTGDVALQRLVVQSGREAEVATMVVRELRARREADQRARLAATSPPAEAARVEADIAANLLLGQARVFAERPELRSAAGWRCELILAAFPDSAAAKEARRLLDSSGRSQRGESPIVRRGGRTTQTDILRGATL
ncbi:MAG: hypothetical protein AMXMBFR47_40250 [Planctomycetota bacterium]